MIKAFDIVDIAETNSEEDRMYFKIIAILFMSADESNDWKSVFAQTKHEIYGSDESKKMIPVMDRIRRDGYTVIHHTSQAEGESSFITKEFYKIMLPYKMA